MALTIHTISGVKYSTTNINQITNANFTPNLVQLLEGGSGLVEAGFIAVPGAAPEFAFSTTAVKTALATLGDVDGIGFSSSELIWFFQKVTDGGLRAGASSHIKATAAKGLIVPLTLTIPHQGKAVITYRVILISADGTTAPIAFTASQSLDAGIVVGNEVYVLGGVSLNNSDLDGVSSVTIDFGLGVWIDGGSGLYYPTHSGISVRRPSITIQTKYIDAFVSWSLDGQAVDSNDCIVTITGLTEGGGLNGSDQVTFTVDEGHMFYSALGGSDGERVAGQVILTPTYDGTNETIVVGGLS